MEIIKEILSESVSGGFWKFIGYYLMIALILGIPSQVIYVAIDRPLRYMTKKKSKKVNIKEDRPDD